MNPPLWAMLIAVIVASIPKLQHRIFDEDTFISNSVTRAVTQSGGVAVPLILVVLGANLARNTLPQDAHDVNSEENQIGTKLLIASLISRMLLPTLIMAPMLALAAKYVPVSILDDPIFVIVCFLLTGAPSALQLAQICQINGVYEGVMSKLLFQSYVIWYVLHNQSPLSLLLTQSLGFSHQHSSSSCAHWKSSNGRTCNLFPVLIFLHFLFVCQTRMVSVY
jgi:predicted permease